MVRDRAAEPLVPRRRSATFTWLAALGLAGALSCASADAETSANVNVNDSAQTDVAENGAVATPMARSTDGMPPESPAGPVRAPDDGLAELLNWTGTDADRLHLIERLDELVAANDQALADHYSGREVSETTIETIEGSADSVVVTTCVEVIDPTVGIGQGRLASQRNLVDLSPTETGWEIEAIADGTGQPSTVDPDSPDQDLGCVTAERAQRVHDVVEGFLTEVQLAQRQPLEQPVSVQTFATTALLDSLIGSIEALAQARIYYDDPQRHWIDVRGSNPVLSDGFVVQTCTYYPDGTTALVQGEGSVAEAETPFAAGTTLTRSWNVVSEPDAATEGPRHLVAELRWQRLDQDCRPDDTENHRR